MTDLEITTQKPQADMVIITLKGTVRNVDSYYDLHNIFNTFLDFQVYKIITDLSELGYITSLGAGVLVSAGLVALKHKGRIVLVNPQPKVKVILDLIGITQICSLVNHLTEAFKVLGVSQKELRELERKTREEQKRLRGLKGRQFGRHNP